jgi:hypothetical protein
MRRPAMTPRILSRLIRRHVAGWVMPSSRPISAALSVRVPGQKPQDRQIGRIRLESS